MIQWNLSPDSSITIKLYRFLKKVSPALILAFDACNELNTHQCPPYNPALKKMRNAIVNIYHDDNAIPSRF
jgi:hypothetical protein